MSDRRFRRTDGYRTACRPEKTRLRRIPGGDHPLAWRVVGAVILIFGELGRDIGSAISRDGDADESALIFDFSDDAHDRGTARRIAWPFQNQAVVADRIRIASDRDHGMAADELRCEFGFGMVEDVPGRVLLLDLAG